MKQDPCQVQSTKDWGGVHCFQHTTSTEMVLATHSLPNHRPQGTMLKINSAFSEPWCSLKKYTVILILSRNCGKDQRGVWMWFCPLQMLRIWAVLPNITLILFVKWGG